jgi:regulator of replication initiation timing
VEQNTSTNKDSGQIANTSAKERNQTTSASNETPGTSGNTSKSANPQQSKIKGRQGKTKPILSDKVLEGKIKEIDNFIRRETTKDTYVYRLEQEMNDLKASFKLLNNLAGCREVTSGRVNGSSIPLNLVNSARSTANDIQTAGYTAPQMPHPSAVQPNQLPNAHHDKYRQPQAEYRMQNISNNNNMAQPLGHQFPPTCQVPPNNPPQVPTVMTNITSIPEPPKYNTLPTRQIPAMSPTLPPVISTVNNIQLPQGTAPPQYAGSFLPTISTINGAQQPTVPTSNIGQLIGSSFPPMAHLHPLPGMPNSSVSQPVGYASTQIPNLASQDGGCSYSTIFNGPANQCICNPLNMCPLHGPMQTQHPVYYQNHMAITHQIQQDVQSKMQQLKNDFFAQIQQIKQDFTNQMFQQQIQVQMLKQQINSNNAQKDYLYLELQSLRSEVQFQGVEIKKEKRSKYNGKQKQKGNQSREQVKQVPPRSENTTYNNTESIDNPTIQSEEASIKTTSINYDEEPVIKPISLCVQPYGETLVQSITPHGETLVQSITPPGETLVQSITPPGETMVQSFTVYPEEEMVEEPVVKL